MFSIFITKIPHPIRIVYEIFLFPARGYSQYYFFSLTTMLMIRKVTYVLVNAEIG